MRYFTPKTNDAKTGESAAKGNGSAFTGTRRRNMHEKHHDDDREDDFTAIGGGAAPVFEFLMAWVISPVWGFCGWCKRWICTICGFSPKPVSLGKWKDVDK